MSYLREVKGDLFLLVDALQVELLKEEAGSIPEVLGAWKKDLWRHVEGALKTSFKNGRETAGVTRPADGKWPRRRSGDLRQLSVKDGGR